MTTSKNFRPTYSKIKNDKNTLTFTISGDEKYGLDKSLINGIRRTLLTDIKTIAMNPDHIIIDKNSGSLHNEFLKHRISLIPLYIDPENYNNSLLFELKVKMDDNPTMNIYSNNFNIYPLKNEYMNALKNEDIDTIEMLKNPNKSYYNLNNPISNTEKKKIFKPYNNAKLSKEDFYMLITELKNTDSETDIQELDLYTVPRIGTGRDHSRYNNLPTVLYTFTKDDTAFQKHLKDSIILENIKDKDKEKYTNSLKLKDSERYFLRDMNDLSYSYDFKIQSNHHFNSNVLYKISLDILIGRLQHISEQLEILANKPDDSVFSYDKFKGDLSYQIIMYKEDDTTGNIIQSHMVNKFLDHDSTIQLCGYKKPHPLTELIIFNVMIKPGNYTELQKRTYIIKTFVDVCKDLIDILGILKNEFKL
jgi:DNA-directed RNA polymerase subunit L